MPVHRYVTRMNVFRFLIADLGPVDMKAGLARSARPPGK